MIGNRLRAALAVAAATFAVAAALAVQPAQGQQYALTEGSDGRDLKIVRFNADNTVDCARWCGLLESCC